MDKWDSTKSNTFWSKRLFRAVCRDDSLLQKVQEQNEQNQSQQNTQIALKHEFVKIFYEHLSCALGLLFLKTRHFGLNIFHGHIATIVKF